MHTPGPWKLFEGEHSEVVEVLDNRGLPIVSWGGFDDSRRTDEEHNANARLIAKAPAMFNELIVSIERGLALGYSCEDQLELYKRITGEEYDYDKAIRKARTEDKQPDPILESLFLGDE